MDEFFKQVVDQDTVEAWRAVRIQMPWNFADSRASEISSLNLVEVVLDEIEYDGLIREIQLTEPGTFWGEYRVDIGGLTIGESFSPYIIDCQEVTELSGAQRLGPDLTHLYRTSIPGKTIALTHAISFLAVACPRCHLNFSHGNEEVLLDGLLPDSWTDNACLACGGSGEWWYELGISGVTR